MNPKYVVILKLAMILDQNFWIQRIIHTLIGFGQIMFGQNFGKIHVGFIFVQNNKNDGTGSLNWVQLYLYSNICAENTRQLCWCTKHSIFQLSTILPC